MTMVNDERLAARALRHRAEDADEIAGKMEAAGGYSAAAKVFRDEAAACRRVAERLAPFVPGNHHAAP